MQDMENLSLLVLSCDSYEFCWNNFILCLKKFWENHPKLYLVTETKKAPENFNTININSACWTERFRKALEQIPTNYIIVMLEDFFIRSQVDVGRIKYCYDNMNMRPDIAVFNFETKFRECSPCEFNGFQLQYNNQMYLNSTQPSLWNKQILLSRLKDNLNAWEWEMTEINSAYKHYLNCREPIINIGYKNCAPFSVHRGNILPEVQDFFKEQKMPLLRRE